ncbi:hypothetical protein IFM5058_09847 [Aspergillus udagawae]|nr:hypothetical protein IFM5058_09847 [Aspergillus udagawae]
MTLKTLFISENFIVNYDDSNPSGKIMAQFVLDVCETELTELTKWFGLSNGFGSTNRIPVTIKPINRGAADNRGYRTDGSSYINIAPLSGNRDYVEPVTHMLFVNELFELLMGQRDPDRNSWDAGGSDGEGLSQFLGIMRFADGHYKGYHSFAASWLTSLNGRQDFVNDVEVTEKQKDNPFPLFSFQFAANKSSFSKAEIQNSLTKGAFNDSLRLVLEGCSPFMLTQLGVTTPTQPTFAAGSKFSGTHVIQQAQVLFQNGTLRRAPQEIEFFYNVHFDPTILNAFTTAPQTEELASSIVINLPDPFFVTFAPGKSNQVWASEDLRVFSAVPGTQPVRGGPSLLNNSIPGAFEYITALLKYLSTNFGDSPGTDPFEPSSNVLPDQTYALQGNSSVVPSTAFVNQPGGSTVYNFAVARVRLDGSFGTTTNGPVGVFFRMWSTATPDTAYNDARNYNSHKSSVSLPDWPLPAPDVNTFPFFATSNTPAFFQHDSPEYGSNGANSQVIMIKNSKGQQWAYFGCFLNVYDVNNIIGGDSIIHLLHGAHHCVVAQIAYDDAPIQTSSGVVVAPGNCDKLVQRNLQITLAYNPGLSPTNRIIQTFDVPPIDPSAVSDDYVSDELMINWGKVPIGSIASIYWPSASAIQAVALADKRYAYHSLTAVDANTIESEVIRGVTYVPIPLSSGANLAGLLTIELTPVSRGKHYSIIVQRVSRRRIPVVQPPRIARRVPNLFGHTINENLPAVQTLGPTIISAQSSATTNHSPDIGPGSAGPSTGQELQPSQQGLSVYRIVTGAFQVNISVRPDDEVLPYDEETLSIFKWRLSVMQPSDRWYPEA